MTQLSATKFGVDWLACFKNSAERDAAAALIDAVLLVNRDELNRGLYQLLDQTMTERADPARPIALYAERSVDSATDSQGIKTILPLFPGTKHGKATGLGVAPITIDPEDQEIGSEGMIGNLITNYCRLYKPMALSHPGPDDLRGNRVSRIVIVTDFIGSGKRVWEMLESFRAVASLRSWRSYGFIDFCVVAYSGTVDGLDLVQRSHLVPTVKTLVGCPTLQNSFNKSQITAVKDLCKRHPKRHDSPFGFGGVGALIAFSHGVPNNAPPILHSTKAKWTPLFQRRSTVGADLVFPIDETETVVERAKRLLHIRIARNYLDNPQERLWITTMIVLATIEDGARTIDEISSQAAFKLTETKNILTFTRIALWTNAKNRLTKLGRQELARLRRRRKRTPVLPSDTSLFYYPTQLRAR